MSLERSRELYERSCRAIAGGVNSNFRLLQKPHPLFFTSGKGSRLTDADGNVYVDYILGLGPLIFGHSPDFLLQAVAEKMQLGQMFAAQHELELVLAEKIQATVPCAELVRFSSSGTEAVQACVRLARAFTKRPLVVKFEGHYHGWSDGMLFSTSASLSSSGSVSVPLAVPMSAGLPTALAGDLLVLPWNDIEAVRQAFKEWGADVAAIITEPIMCNTSCMMPRPGYLEALRELCSENGSVLIFDEVITGFRLHTGGAQGYFGVTPDLATFGKAMGGGFPISMLAGRRDIMQLIGTGEVVHSGTANGNIMSVAAASAALERICNPVLSPIHSMQSVGTSLMTGLRRLAEKHSDSGLLVQGPGPVFAVSFAARKGAACHDYRSYVEQTDADKLQQFVNCMLKHGVRVKAGIWFTSATHTEEDVAFTLAAAEKSLLEMRRGGSSRL
eukprot:TRINITY_DN122327_c0_g1_i1.p1 TRINITY_DN122327_c0_g1~~TRINITY_DN122327_c0_g1_i1.p1  ORF type:complete len:444 (+),score=81.55 TRINITY_DN122327_c0_g1_i1:27-1358(+)